MPKLLSQDAIEHYRRAGADAIGRQVKALYQGTAKSEFRA